ncbi:MAG: DUF4198 domain-containing protein [Desulfobacteraceae bacterium]|nr:DUF4198 domain-containing protein [Desulfobacteraceae bacterium]
MTKRIFSLLIGLVCILFFPIIASAHGTGYRILENSRAIVVEFYYSGEEPMSYAQVLVFSPQDRKTEYQNGRTDRKGRFAFYPDIAGAWRIGVSDGLGHKVEAEIGSISGKPDQAESQRQSESSGLNTTSKVFLGISVILCLTALILWLNAGKILRKAGKF